MTASFAGVPNQITQSTVARTMGAATVMSSPPTIVENGSAFTLPVGTFKNPTDAAFQSSGAPLYDGGNGLSVTASGREPTRSDATPVSTWSGAMRWAFDFDGTAFEFQVLQFGGTSYRIWVNEQMDASAVHSFVNVNGFVTVTFGSRAYRRIVVELIGAVYFRGTRNSNDGVITKSQLSTSRWCWIGDSYGYGVGANDPGRAFSTTAMRLLGMRDFYNQASVSGTGILATAATYGRYATRLTNDVVPLAPTGIVIQGSLNDVNQGKTPSACAAELHTLIGSIRAALPSALIVCTSPLYAAIASNIAGLSAMNTALAAQAATDGVPFVDVIGEVWFTGTGRVGATNGTGNSDFYLSADTVHPPQAGHDYLAAKLAGALGRLTKMAGV